MKYKKAVILQLVTSLLCLVMIILETVYFAKSLPQNYSMFILFIILAYISWIAGVVTTVMFDNTVGLGLVTLAPFFTVVATAFPGTSSGSSVEFLILYAPVLLMSTALIAVRGGANFKRVMLVTIGLIYVIVSIYMVAKGFYDKSKIPTSLSSAVLKDQAREVIDLHIAQTFFSLFYYISLLASSFILFRNKEAVQD